MKKIIFIFIATLAAFTFACEQKDASDHMNDAKEEMKDAGESMKESSEEMMDKATNAGEEAKDTISKKF